MLPGWYSLSVVGSETAYAPKRRRGASGNRTATRTATIQAPQPASARTSASSASTLAGSVSQAHMKRAPPAPMKV